MMGEIMSERSSRVKGTEHQFLMGHPFDIIKETIGPGKMFDSDNFLPERLNREGERDWWINELKGVLDGVKGGKFESFEG